MAPQSRLADALAAIAQESFQRGMLDGDTHGGDDGITSGSGNVQRCLDRCMNGLA